MTSNTFCSASRSSRLRDAGLSVTTGTINHAAVAERALAHAPDAVTTDRPHQLAAELAERRRLAA